MLLPQGLDESDVQHLALLHFPSEEKAKQFRGDPQLQRLSKEVLEKQNESEWRPRRLFPWPWRLRPRRFSKASSALLAQQLALLSGPVAAVHFVSSGVEEHLFSAARGTRHDVARAGGRCLYEATETLAPSDDEQVAVEKALWLYYISTVKYSTVPYRTVPYRIVSYGIVSHRIVWYGMVWYGMVWYSTVWYSILSYRIV